MDDTEDMDLNNPVDDEETERKLLAGSDEELDDEGKLDDENVDLGSDSDEEKMETSTAAATKGSDSDDDSDSDDNDEEDNAADEAEVQNFVSILEQNPYDYEAHKSLIEKLQTMGCLDRLRNARENMSAKYPLTSEIWLSWLKDEMKLAVTPEQKLPVLELCDRAVKDYLYYSTTEEEVKAVLESVGPITLIRMVKDFKGRNKGFCYVQFENENQVEEALKLDRTPINNRPMFISRCDPDKTSRGPIFKYKTELEKNKLFVKETRNTYNYMGMHKKVTQRAGNRTGYTIEDG
ncbi:unnamed protein product [Trichogramma brassicae]|uniref:RRM domain-containing protein n=1 Tax=Trichogramma brassicae TaxID=86971 RepID=A0A6H5IEF3_9HYME|nr:unnamed protein product [Trichogramma brassicae]